MGRYSYYDGDKERGELLMQKVAVILLGSAGINIGECYRENYSRKVPFLLFESHKTRYQAERCARLIEKTFLEKDASAENLMTTHAVRSAEAITKDYFENVPDYIEGPLGKVLFFTTAEEQFSNSSPEKTLARAEFYEQEIVQAMCAYDHVILVACMGGSVSNGVAPYIAQLAKQHRISIEAILTLPATFEGKKRRQQAAKAMTLLKKNTMLTLLTSEQSEESMVEYFKVRDQAIVKAINEAIMRYYEI